MQLFSSYERSSGQLISQAKSRFYFHDKFQRRASVVARVTGFKRCSFPLIYLGAPIFYGRVKTVYFEYLVDKARQSLDRWKARVLSFGCHITLLTSVLQSYPIYTLSSTMVLKSILRRLGSLMGQCLGNVRGQARTHWVNWRSICIATTEGGLGIRRIEEVKDALQAKLLWLSLTGDLLWARYACSKYFVGEQHVLRAHASMEEVNFSTQQPAASRAMGRGHGG